MNDMFDCDIGMPTKPIARSLISPDHGFSDFWKSYPPGPRRVAKPQCLAKWIKLGCANNSLHIIMHVEHMKTDESWIRGFHPMALTYLNQQRWLDFEPPAPKPAQKTWLEEYSEHEKRCTKPSAEIRAKMAQLRK